MARTPKPAEAEPAKITFSKAKILTFQRYAPRRDLLGALLEEDRPYTLEEVDAAIEKFMKGKVK